MSRKKNLNLSKSTLIRSLQCQKSLYLYKNYYHLRDEISPEQQAKFQRGHDFGKLAHDLFPGGIDVSPDSPRFFMKAVKETQEYLKGLFPTVIYEAAFRHNTTLVYLDILVPKDGRWYAYEVKSSRGISQTYIRDAAIQYFVITREGLPLEDFYIVHVRKDFDPEVHLTAEDIFVKESVLEEIKAMSEFVEEAIADALSTLEGDDVPDICMGDHCDNPYPCDFKGVCSRQEAGFG